MLRVEVVPCVVGAIIGLYICRKEVLINSHVRVIAEQCFESQSFYDFCFRPQRGIEGFLFSLIYYWHQSFVRVHVITIACIESIFTVFSSKPMIGGMSNAFMICLSFPSDSPLSWWEIVGANVAPALIYLFRSTEAIQTEVETSKPVFLTIPSWFR